MSYIQESTKIEKILKKLELDFKKHRINDDRVKKEIAMELDTFANLILDMYPSSMENKNDSKIISKRDNINTDT